MFDKIQNHIKEYGEPPVDDGLRYFQPDPYLLDALLYRCVLISFIVYKEFYELVLASTDGKNVFSVRFFADKRIEIAKHHNKEGEKDD